MSGASTVVDLLDNDDAGKAGSAELQRKLGLYMRIIKPEYNGKDVGEMCREQFNKEIIPVLEKL